jgi:hypothetical protein
MVWRPHSWGCGCGKWETRKRGRKRGDNFPLYFFQKKDLTKSYKYVIIKVEAFLYIIYIVSQFHYITFVLICQALFSKKIQQKKGEHSPLWRSSLGAFCSLLGLPSLGVFLSLCAFIISQFCKNVKGFCPENFFYFSKKGLTKSF